MRKDLKSAILLVIISVVWGFAFSAQRLGADKVSAITFFTFRNYIAVVTMAIFVFFIRKDDDLTDNAYSIKLGIVCGLVEFAATLIQQFSIGITTAANCSFITSMYVVLVPILSLFVGKKPAKKIWLCVGLEIVGMYLLCVKEGFVINKGDLLAMITAVLFAVHIICIDSGGQKMDPILVCFAQFGVCAVLATVLLFIFEMPLDVEGIKGAMIPLLYTGVLSSAICLTIQVSCQKNLDPTVASLIMCLESVFGAVGGWIVLNEVLSVRELIGCTIMFVAIVLSQLPSKKAK